MRLSNVSLRGRDRTAEMLVQWHKNNYGFAIRCRLQSFDDPVLPLLVLRAGAFVAQEDVRVGDSIGNMHDCTKPSGAHRAQP